MMTENSDINNREDIERLIKDFYERAISDNVIGHFFTEVVQLNWQTHIPLICDFWESILFQTGSYKGNPIEVHMKLNRLSNLKPKHFDRWVRLFHETVDLGYTGPIATLAKTRATSIATVMQIKIHNQKQ